jgi:hypothetical protein
MARAGRRGAPSIPPLGLDVRFLGIDTDGDRLEPFRALPALTAPPTVRFGGDDPRVFGRWEHGEGVDARPVRSARTAVLLLDPARPRGGWEGQPRGRRPRYTTLAGARRVTLPRCEAVFMLRARGLLTLRARRHPDWVTGHCDCLTTASLAGHPSPRRKARTRHDANPPPHGRRHGSPRPCQQLPPYAQLQRAARVDANTVAANRRPSVNISSS